MTSSRFARCLPTVLIALTMSLPVAAEQAVTKAQRAKDVYPGLFSGALMSAKPAILPVGILLRSGDSKITQKDLDAEIAKAPQDVRSQLKSNAFFVLENRATRDLLTVEAKAWAKGTGRKPDANANVLLRAYLDDLTGTIAVTDDELKEFFESNKDMMGGAAFDQVKDQLRNYVLNEKRQQFVDAHIGAIGDRRVVEVNKSWAARQYILAMNNPIAKARKSGKPTMVDFGADGCRPCDMMTPILDSLKKEYAGKANVLFVHVRKEQMLAARYGVESIPVQVFFDRSGQELFRHVGFFPKEQIVSKLAEIGAK